jgi:hypothetical protein
MAGMKGDGRFQQLRSDEEYDAACELVISRGHGGLKLTAEETGIPVDTLKAKVRDYRDRNADLIELPPVPDNSDSEGLAKLKGILWVETCRLEEKQKAGQQVSAKHLTDLINAHKGLAGLQAPKAEKPSSALSSLQAAA